MRLIATALSLAAFASPALAQDCRFFNLSDQSIVYRHADRTLTFDPLFADTVECGVVGETEGNGYALACSDGPRTLVTGSSEPEKPFVDIIVLDNVFFWLKCEETT